MVKGMIPGATGSVVNMEKIKRGDAVRASLCHKRRMTPNNLQNFTKFSRTSVRLHSVRFVGFNFCDPPPFCRWTTPSTPSGWTQIDLNDTLRTLSDT